MKKVKVTIKNEAGNIISERIMDNTEITYHEGTYGFSFDMPTMEHGQTLSYQLISEEKFYPFIGKTYSNYLCSHCSWLGPISEMLSYTGIKKLCCPQCGKLSDLNEKEMA